MNEIAVITSTRAEFGLLMPVLKALRKYENDELRINLVVTGTHLNCKFGHTVDEIKNVGMRIDYEILTPVKSDKVSIKKAINKALSQEFRKKCRRVVNPYGNGNAAEQIAKKIVEVIKEDKIDLKKKFYDIKLR